VLSCLLPMPWPPHPILTPCTPRCCSSLLLLCSWVFGDGDPNADYDRQRWQAVSSPAIPPLLPAWGQCLDCKRLIACWPSGWLLGGARCVCCTVGCTAPTAPQHSPHSTPQLSVSLSLLPAPSLQIGRYIQARGGTVVAEEIAPFLDLKPGQLAADRGKITGAWCGWAGLGRAGRLGRGGQWWLVGQGALSECSGHPPWLDPFPHWTSCPCSG